ncbi:MAG: asparagine synthase (glutamine-hydrolyzing) [Nitrospirota bacterium]|nr:asparagine synthase (glutamine-hydrolyzing) [Nitrospirota bacterium]
MCGICGVVNFDGRPVVPEILRTMVRAMAHRGPDGAGEFLYASNESSRPAVGLGHRRLAVIDLSPTARQPMTNEDHSLAIVFNGEIYNFRELRGRLLANGHSFSSNSDTEVVLRLYEEMGPTCVNELDGMFAFAVWDTRRQRLLLARDRAGKKPLYYTSVGTTFAFASEVKALLHHPSVSGEFMIEALPHYFSFGYPPPGRTFYRGIDQLPPAHTLIVNAEGHLSSERYWDLDFAEKPSRAVSIQDAATQVRSLVTEAVRKRLVADVPLGAFLSGGIDSSIVVGLMSHLLGRPVQTFSIGFAGDQDFDETPYARQVADYFRTDHTECLIAPQAIESIESLVWHYDGPFGDPSALPTYVLAQFTRPHVTVTLNGDGGDELFAGYLRFYACLAAEHIPPPLSRLCHLAMRSFPEPQQYHHWLRRAQRFFAGASSPLVARMQRWVSIFDHDLHRLLRPEVFDGIATNDLGYPPEMLASTASFTPLSKMLYINFMTYLPDDLLVKTDRVTMAHGLESRSPFLDHRLAEYLAGLPDQYKLRRGTTKYLLKTAFADLLPATILRRGKKGFGVPLGAWFRGELREYLQDLLLSPHALSRQYLQTPYVADLVREHTEGVRDHGQRLWAVLTFETWLRLAQRGQGLS